MSPLFDRLRSRTAAFSHDLLMIPVAWLLAYWLRFNLGQIPPEFMASAWHSLPWVVVVQGAVYWLFGLYRGVWRFASLPDLVRIVKAAAAGTLLVVVTLFIVSRTELIPRSVPVLFLGLQLLLLAGPRLLYRWIKDHRLNFSSGKRVLIVGAGRAGEMLVRDMLRDGSRAYFPAGFVDDKPRRQGGDVHRQTAAIIFDLVFVAGIVILVVRPAIEHRNPVEALVLGAILGLVTYAAYDLTNLATLEGFPVKVAVVDLVWGTVLCATVSLVTYLVASRWVVD